MKKVFLLMILVSGLIAFIPSAQATIIEYELDYEFSGAQQPESSVLPWLTATFNDDDTAGSVTLTLETTNLIEQEWVSEWYFNFDPDLNPDGLSIAYDSSVIDKHDTGIDEFKADGDGFFDIWFEFEHLEGDFGSTVVYFTGSEITANSFAYFSAPGGGNGSWGSAAHVQSIDRDDIQTIDMYGEDNNKGSGFIGGNYAPAPVPEPATMLILGSGLIGIAGFGRKKFKK